MLLEPWIQQWVDEVDPVTSDTAWMIRAECYGMSTDLFFPERGQTGRRAKAICAVCVVRIECLDYSLEKQSKFKFGIWGGLTEKERRPANMRRLTT